MTKKIAVGERLDEVQLELNTSPKQGGGLINYHIMIAMTEYHINYYSSPLIRNKLNFI